MSDRLPLLYLARHGETEWSKSHQHTGRTDLPLTADGESQARRLGERLGGLQVGHVFTSPLRRASRTCDIAGFAGATVEEDLVEWAYGDYEGKKTAEIRSGRPGWDLFRDGCPGGETIAEVGARADRFITRVRKTGGDVIAFSSGHILRVIAARWLGLPPDAGRYFLLRTASISALGYEHGLDEPVIKLWDDTGELHS